MNPQPTYSDHDLLVLAIERIGTLSERLSALVEIFETEKNKLEDRVTILERNADKQSGFLGGARWLWGIIAAIPVTVLVALREVRF